MNTMDGGAKEALVALLRELARQIQSMDGDAVIEILSGKAKLEVSIVGKKKTAQTKNPSNITDEDLRSLGELLRTTRTRDEGNRLLDEKFMSKNDMSRLARLLDLPVQKTDSVEQIRARVIESTIGFRIRSAAVQGVTSTTADKPIDPVD